MITINTKLYFSTNQRETFMARTFPSPIPRAMKLYYFLARRFLVLVILVSFFFPSSTMQARSLNAQTGCHLAKMKPLGKPWSDGLLYYSSSSPLENFDPISSRRALFSGPSLRGDGHRH
jgi:hypothetical protein